MHFNKILTVHCVKMTATNAAVGYLSMTRSELAVSRTGRI